MPKIYADLRAVFQHEIQDIQIYFKCSSLVSLTACDGLANDALNEITIRLCTRIRKRQIYFKKKGNLDSLSLSRLLRLPLETRNSITGYHVAGLLRFMNLSTRETKARRYPPRVSCRINPARYTTDSEIGTVRLGIVTVYKILSQRHYSSMKTARL